ncbi:MAG: hypothetical protein ACPGPC_16920 [Alphaproteobacteria bacterium]|jgi:hypothetical protein
MNWDSTVLGAILGIGCVFVYRGIGTLRNKEIEEKARRKGFWPLNAGLALIAVSMVLFARLKGG